MRRAMGHRNVLIRTFVPEKITMKLSRAVRYAGISCNMRRGVEGSVYWPVTHNVRWPKESIEQNVKLAK